MSGIKVEFHGQMDEQRVIPYACVVEKREAPRGCAADEWGFRLAGDHFYCKHIQPRAYVGIGMHPHLQVVDVLGGLVRIVTPPCHDDRGISLRHARERLVQSA